MLTNGRETEKSVCFTYIFSFCAIGSVNMKVNVGDRVEMKKPHPCGCKEFEILRIGMDFKIRCTNCGREVMVPRNKVEKNIKKILTDKEK